MPSKHDSPATRKGTIAGRRQRQRDLKHEKYPRPEFPAKDKPDEYSIAWAKAYLNPRPETQMKKAIMQQEYSLAFFDDDLGLFCRQLRKAGVPIEEAPSAKALTSVKPIAFSAIELELGCQRLSLKNLQPDGPPLVVPYELGRRLELLMQVLRPINHIDSVDGLAKGVAGLADEEVSYWLSKLISRGDDTGGRFKVLRALRMLLGYG